MNPGARSGAVLALALGALAIIVATVLGADAGVLERIVTPPPLIRAALVGGGVALGLILFARSLGRMSASGTDDVPGLIRAVRLAFLGIAAWSAAAGWAIGHPLPLIVAAVIAGVDVVETSFLLLVVGRR